MATMAIYPNGAPTLVDLDEFLWEQLQGSINPNGAIAELLQRADPAADMEKMREANYLKHLQDLGLVNHEGRASGKTLSFLLNRVVVAGIKKGVLLLPFNPPVITPREYPPIPMDWC